MALPAEVLAARDLAGCEHRLALDFAHPDLVRDRPDTPGVARRKDAAASHRARVRELLRGIHSDQPGAFVVVDGADHATRVDQTLAACADGAPWIWNATLPTDVEGGRRGHAELLVAHGTGYLPVIVVNHRVSQPSRRRGDEQSGITTSPITTSPITTSPLWEWLPGADPNRSSRPNRRDSLRLAHLTMMLSDLGLGVPGDPGALLSGAIGLDADCIVVHKTGALLDEYAAILARRRDIVGGRVTTVARRVSECRSCHWWGRCGPELRERRDVSLVANGNQAAALADVGITTIDKLAHHRGPVPAGWPGNVAFDDAIVTAVAWLTDTELVRRVDRPEVRRADIEVDVDMESFGEDGAYLWGTLTTDNTRRGPEQAVYLPFVTWDPLPTRDEARSFAAFWAWLMASRAAAHEAGHTFAAYCYSQQAENRWLLGSADRFADVDGIPSRAEVEAFIGSPEWVDIYEAVGRNFVCPRGKGLKVVAPAAGFAWRDDDASGEASMGWYQAAVALDGGRPDLGQRRRLLEYNEDDVRATKALREWITDGAIAAAPHQRDLLAFRSAPDNSPHA